MTTTTQTPDTTIDHAILDTIAATDPQVAQIVRAEAQRQEYTIELIASENHASPAVTVAAGTCMTNKYAEGYPGRRYYGGCAHHDQVEQLARDRAKELFGCKFANVQPHSGAQANTAAFMAMMEPGDTFLSLVLKDGGHLSHGMFLNFSGIFYNPVHYALHYDKAHPQHEQIDYESVRAAALEHKPKMILCGYSAYSRQIDFAKFREIADEVGATLMADIAHIAGLVAAGEHPSPFPHAHIVTTTTHKSLRGPRGGLIMTNDEDLNKLINRNVFPGVQGGPLMHIITAKAVAFGEALKPEFKAYQQQVIKNARALAGAMTEHGFRITSGGTDNHLMLVSLVEKDADLTGKEAEKWLEDAGLITNKNGIPDDPRSPMITSGLRLGTPATTTRGFKEPEMAMIAAWINRVIESKGDEPTISTVRAEVKSLCERFPLHH
jgi:glycine hydroxymethyltransferase